VLKLIRSGLLAGLFACAVSCATAPTQAHGALIPITLGHTHSTLGLGHTHSVLAFPGAGSFTTRVNSSIIKSITAAGYSNGQSLAVSKLVQGAVSSGYLSGQTYYNFGGTNYFNYTLQTYSIGSNPYNNSSIPASSVPTNINYLTFVSGGSLGPNKGAVALPVFGLSGAQRTKTAFYNSIASSSTYAGYKSIQSLGPITGGELNGTFFYGAGSNFDAYGKVILALGNNPLNSGSIGTLINPSLSNYLTFGSVTRQIVGGQLTFNLYAPFYNTNYGPYALAFGNSPLNVGIGPVFPMTSFHSAIYFVPIILKSHHF
jgi:hypothetical protein